ncbi:MAG: Crp/Fnr family transcriptional regulator [Bacteroidota bacterium]
MYPQLKNYLNQITPLTEEEWHFLLPFLRLKSLDKGEILVHQGQINHSLIFVLKGALRTFFLSKGREINLDFTFANHMVSCYHFFRREPSDEFIQAMQTSEILIMEVEDAESFLGHFPNAQKLAHKLMSCLLLNEVDRLKAQLALNPEEIYAKIEQEHPQYIHKVQSQHLASYIGITRESLSRIKKRRSQK